MTAPTLALCIPAYRAEEHLPRLLETARQQDPPFDEIIVCVDASPDRTAQVAERLGARVIVNEQNLGCSGSKNQALALATSDWVHFHDADDILLPGFTREAQRWMRMLDAPDVVVMGYEWRDFETNELLAVGAVDDEAIQRDPISYTIEHMIPNFGLYRTERLKRVGGFLSNPAYLYTEDRAFHIALALQGFRFRSSTVVTSINWRHGSSMSREHQDRCNLSLIAVMKDLSVDPRVPIAARKSVHRWLWCAARELVVHRGPLDVCLSAIAVAERMSPRPPAQLSTLFRGLVRLVGSERAFTALYHAYPSLKAVQNRLRGS
jgi:glycosyltransferase involved in cell wall biosynthesis